MDDMTPQWRTASYSTAQGSCVELGNGSRGQILVRDTKQSRMAESDRTTVPFSETAWRRAVASIKESNLSNRSGG